MTATQISFTDDSGDTVEVSIDNNEGEPLLVIDIYYANRRATRKYVEIPLRGGEAGCFVQQVALLVKAREELS